MAKGEGGRSWKSWQLLVAAAVAFVLGIAAGAGTAKKDKTVAASGQPATTQATTPDTPATTAVTAPRATAATAATTPAPTTTVAAAPVDIATFTGASTKTTDTFAIRNPWKLRWTITGGAGVGIEVLDQGGSRLDYISADPGTDESVERRACTCYLKLSPFGSSYTIKVNGVPA